MITKQVHFGGLVTDLFPTRTPSGTADVATNVTVRNGELQKRGGFTQYENDVDGSATGITNLHVARFADGDVYVIARVGSATISTQLYHRKSSLTDFSAITTGQTHNQTDPGWFFMCHDRLHYFDRAGGSRWNPDVNSATAYKAGLIKPTYGAIPETAAGGEKDGYYHIHLAYRNSVTLEESVCTTTHTPGMECRIATNTGGLAVTSATWTNISAADTAYEADQVVIYCTNGNTEWIAIGSGVECFSYAAYIDVVASKSGSTPGLNKADHVHDRNEMMKNSGGEPPGACTGLILPGHQAIYGDVYESGTLVPGKIMFSIAGYPTMVPQRVTYSIGGDSKTVVPKPWDGFISGAINGETVAMAYGAGAACLFTPASTYTFAKSEDGRPYPILRHPGKGCAAVLGAVGSPFGVYAMGYRCLLRVAGDTVTDLADGRFSTTLAEIPAAQQHKTIGAYYSYRNQIWFAVVKSGATIAQRILVLDLTAKALTVFDPACFATGECITAMCELAYSGVEPTMLVGTNQGRILQYPSGARDQKLDETYSDYACEWRGYVGQERAAKNQKLSQILMRNGANASANVTVGFRPMRTSDETITQVTYALAKSSALERLAIEVDKAHGNFYQIDITSTASNTGQWTIKDMVFLID